MCRALRLLILSAAIATIGTACASGDRPEVVPGSTIATSSTTTTSPSAADDASTTEGSNSSTTSIPRLDPNDPNYPTTIPPPPQPTVSYPVTG